MIFVELENIRQGLKFSENNLNAWKKCVVLLKAFKNIYKYIKVEFFAVYLNYSFKSLGQHLNFFKKYLVSNVTRLNS